MSRAAFRSAASRIVVATVLLLTGAPAFAAQAQPMPPEHAHGTPAAQPAPADMANMPAMDQPRARTSDDAAPQPTPALQHEGMPDMGQAQPMAMGSMQGGRAPADARDPDAYAHGYANSTLPGFEKTDKLPISLTLIDQAEFVIGNEGEGFAWSGQFAKGGDFDKLWLRSQGLTAGDGVDAETGVEALWWHATGPFFGTTLGVRQDFGPGAHTWLAAGVEGLAPYWFKVELTGYLSTEGTLAGRAKASYDLLLTNRLIATPSVETNLYSRRQSDRGLGSGLSNVELGFRVRYEIQRKFAPYVGLVWERNFGRTAGFKRLECELVTERRLVAGLRLWW
jgi:copper resistance protein B